jgi:hypothetical protein
VENRLRDVIAPVESPEFSRGNGTTDENKDDAFGIGSIGDTSPPAGYTFVNPGLPS